MPIVHIVQCPQCLVMASIPEGQDPHAAFRCACCDEEHHHGEQANNCPREHDGPCWTGPLAGPRPDGCTVCRPLIHFGAGGVS